LWNGIAIFGRFFELLGEQEPADVEEEEETETAEDAAVAI
jgi:hypothetical protein